MSATPARRAAHEALRALRRGELLDRALADALERVPNEAGPWLHELIYGTVRLRGRLDHLLDQLVHKGLSSLEPDVLDILRLGAYQLEEMRSVPDYAAISQSVDLAERVSGRGAAGLVNGVLRNLTRNRERLAFPAFEDDPIAYLSTRGSHPGWLVERWVGRFGAEDARALVEHDNRRPELYMRPVGVSVEAAKARLADAGVGAEPVPFAPDALRLAAGANPVQALAAVPSVIQDPAAGLVSRYAAVPPDATVADLCAAPGGKALELTEDAGYVLAADISFERLRALLENASRVGDDDGGLPIGAVVADARRPPLASADVVLLDVPCTGTGTLRRHPDGKWRLAPADVDRLAELQREMLEAAAPLAPPGGLLVYSTCSLEPEENDEQVDEFLERHPEYEPAPPEGIAPELVDGAGRFAMFPQRFGTDGAFAARLRKRT